MESQCSPAEPSAPFLQKQNGAAPRRKAGKMERANGCGGLFLISRREKEGLKQDHDRLHPSSLHLESQILHTLCLHSSHFTAQQAEASHQHLPIMGTGWRVRSKSSGFLALPLRTSKLPYWSPHLLDMVVCLLVIPNPSRSPTHIPTRSRGPWRHQVPHLPNSTPIPGSPGWE